MDLDIVEIIKKISKKDLLLVEFGKMKEIEFKYRKKLLKELLEELEYDGEYEPE